MALIGGGCHPVGSPCPDTWFPNSDGGCEPILDDCPDLTLSLFGGGCLAVGPGDDCGQGTWGGASGGSGSGITWYVWGGYEEEDSDGTKWKPFKTISEAVELISAGDTIIIGAEDGGRDYDEAVSVYEDDISVVGRCSKLVTVSGETKLTSELSAAVRAVYAEGMSISGVTVSGPGGGIGFIGGGGHRVESVAVSGNGDNGIMVIGSDSVVVKQVAVVGNGGLDGGTGISVWDSDDFQISESVLSGNNLVGFYAEGASCALERCLVTGTIDEDKAEGGGYGVNVHSSADVSLVDSAVMYNLDTEILAGTNSKLSVVRTLVADSGFDAADTDQPGVAVQDGAAGVIDEAVIRGNVGCGILIADAVATVSNSLVTGSRGVTGASGRGIQVQSSSETSLVESCFIVGNFGSGIIVSAASLDLMHSVVSRTRGNLDGTDGRGLGLELEASVSVDSCLLDSNREVGMVALHDSSLEVKRTLVRDTQPEDIAGENTAGHGIGVQDGASADISDSTIWGSTDVGLFVDGGSLIMVNSRIGHTQSRADGMFGLGFEGLNSQIDLSWCAFDDNAGGGGLFGHKATVQVEGGLIRGPVDDPSAEGATGLAIVTASAFQGNDITISGSYGFGVVASNSSSVDLAGSVVAHTTPETGGFFGAGILAQSNSQLTVSAGNVLDNFGGGVEIYNASGSVLDSRVVSVNESSGVWLVDGELVPGAEPFADGVSVTGDGDATISGNLVSGCKRAGILFDSSTGSLSDNVISSNKFGVVIQNSEVQQEGNELVDNEVDAAVDLGKPLATAAGPVYAPEPVQVEYE